MTEIWIIGVDHENPSTEPRSRGPIVNVYYAAPEGWGASSALLNGGECKSASLGPGRECTREEVLRWLNAGRSVYTATRDANDENLWDKGDVVEPTKNKRYITTKGNDVAYDNLGSLPSVGAARALLKG